MYRTVKSIFRAFTAPMKNILPIEKFSGFIIIVLLLSYAMLLFSNEKTFVTSMALYVKNKVVLGPILSRVHLNEKSKMKNRDKLIRRAQWQLNWRLCAFIKWKEARHDRYIIRRTTNQMSLLLLLFFFYFIHNQNNHWFNRSGSNFSYFAIFHILLTSSNVLFVQTDCTLFIRERNW